jgi:hypothetical protein
MGYKEIPSSIHDVLNSFLAKNPKKKQMLKRALLAEHWTEVVGEKVAKHTRPGWIVDKRLFIVVKDASWSENLKWFRDKLLKKIHFISGDTSIQEIHFRVGETEDPLPPEEKALEKQHKLPELSDDEKRKIHEELTEFFEEASQEETDPELNEEQMAIKEYLQKDVNGSTLELQRSIEKAFQARLASRRLKENESGQS